MKHKDYYFLEFGRDYRNLRRQLDISNFNLFSLFYQFIQMNLFIILRMAFFFYLITIFLYVQSLQQHCFIPLIYSVNITKTLFIFNIYASARKKINKKIVSCISKYTLKKEKYILLSKQKINSKIVRYLNKKCCIKAVVRL